MLDFCYFKKKYHMANIISKISWGGGVQSGPAPLKILSLVTRATLVSKVEIRGQTEEKVKSGESWMDIDFKRASIPQLLTSCLSSPSSWSVFTVTHGLSSSITEK